MKKLVILGMLSLFLLGICTAAADHVLPAEGVLAANAQLRREPSTDAESMMILMKGQVVTVVDIINGGWTKVEYGRFVGYIRSDLFENTTLTDGENGVQPIDVVKSAGIERTLKEGKRGEDVAVLQDMLFAIGYAGVATDGIFGPTTKAALMDFQQRNGLTRDGILGDETLALLVEYMEAWQAYWEAVNSAA